MQLVWLAAFAFALFLTWSLTRKQGTLQGPVKRLFITVTEGIALVTLPFAYEAEDLGVLWGFLQGPEAAANRARVHSLVYDCSDWRWSNVLGLEMVLWQADAEWTGNTIFCELSPEMKSVLDTLLEGETIRAPLYFATMEEALNYAQAKQARRAL
jgi:hypothetical protein